MQISSPEIVSSKKKNTHEQPSKKQKVHSYDSLSPSMKILYVHLESLSKSEMGMKIVFDEAVFGMEFNAFVYFKEDMIPFCDLRPITGNCMVVYVW